MAGMTSVWDDVVGQPAPVAQLTAAAAAPIHAYLFVGPAGSTKHQAARAFAALLLTGVDDPGLRAARLALAAAHPDVHEVERTGPAISADQAREIVQLTSRAPVEGERKVIVLHDFHLLTAEAAARLLKSIEEPPPSTTFVVLADFVPPELVTIASRCVRVDFRSIPDDVLAGRLEAEGVAADVIPDAVAAAGGDLSRARILAHDPALVERRRAFAELPRRLDGTGTAVVAAVDDLLLRIEEAAAPLVERHTVEVAELDARAEQLGERGSGRRTLEERHRRELRRHRTDELRSGLGVLAGAYRDRLVAGGGHRPDAMVAAVDRIHGAIEVMEHNPNEPLLLQSLLWSLPVDGS
jgi:DNA polymerase III subunit delta'